MRIALPVIVVETAALALVYLRRSAIIAGGFGFPLDDSWIHAHFALNIAEGRGFVYNPGQPCASSAPLYTVCLAAMYLTRLNPVTCAAALGLSLHAAACALVYAAARALSAHRAVAAATAVAFAAVPRLVWGALSGMEVPAYVFLTSLGVYLHVRFRPADGPRSYLSTAAFALSALARPECATIAVVSTVDRTAAACRARRCGSPGASPSRTAAIHLLVIAAVLAPLVVFNLWATSLPLPTAFYVKTPAIDKRGALDLLVGGLGAVPAYLRKALEICFRDGALLALGLAPGILVCVDRRLKGRREGMLLLPVSLVAVPAATALFARTGAQGLQMISQTGRYSAYLVPLAFVCSAVGFDAVVRALGRGKGALRLVGAAVLCAVALVSTIMLVLNNGQMATAYARQVSNINEMQVAIGRWAAELPDDVVLAINDAGAIAYFSGKRVIDIVGVVNPEVVRYRLAHGVSQRSTLEYLRTRHPDYVIIFPTWFPEIASAHRYLEPVTTVRLEDNIVCGGDEMIVYRAAWDE